MSWVTLLGLIRDVATSNAGQEILKDLRSDGNEPETAPPAGGADLERWRASVEHRLRTSDRNVEMLVRMLNAQDEMLIRIQKRQRVWNIVLGSLILVLSGSLVYLGFR
jgi:hypothetical protein